jgi:hypothetical protein
MPFDVRRGDLITLELLERLYNGGGAAGIRASGGINARQGPDGQIQIWGTPSTSPILRAIVATDGISAGSYNTGACTNSGTLIKFSAGTGLVWPAYWDGTCWTADNSKPTISVLSPSTTTGGIPSPTIVLIQQDELGNWWICTANCGNPS